MRRRLMCGTVESVAHFVAGAIVFVSCVSLPLRSVVIDCESGVYGAGDGCDGLVSQTVAAS